jgi:Carboxypeptidase regulatory-like domain/TonB dependent receptor-like, beta-barrel
VRLSCLFLLIVTFPLVAQVDRATLNGAVTDATGAVVPQAKIEVAAPAMGFRRETLTSPTGGYNIPGLPIGTYQVTISHPGFETVELRELTLSVGEVRTFDARLQIGTQTTKVEVKGAAVEVNRTSAEIGGVVAEQQVRSLPLNGRNWADLMALAPGAIDAGSGGGSDQRNIRFSGRSRDDNNYTFDGIDNSGVQEQAQKSDTRLGVSLDAVAEFRVNSAVYTAESGGGGGGQINVVSKTGSNVFHGTGFEFYRNDAMNARGPFGPATLPALTQNQFGGNFGGPIRKNRSFFFANYEAFRQDTSSNPLGFVPSASFRQRALAASPALQPILNTYPTASTYPAATTVVASVSADMDSIRPLLTPTVREDSGIFRFDQRFSDTTTMFVRYNNDDLLKDTPGVMGDHGTVAIRPQNVVVQLLHIFSPRVINEIKVGMNRSGYHSGTAGNTPLGITGLGFSDLIPSALDIEIGTTWNYLDNLTITRGRHTWKMGFEIRRVWLNNSGEALPVTTLTYTSNQNFINNSVDSISSNGALGVGGNRRTFWMGFAQDEIKATSTLTLNLGVRYEYYGVMHEVLERALVVDPLGCGGFCPQGTPYYSPDRNNFAPRVGMAWSPARFKGKTVFRAGFGVYFGANQNDDFSDPHESTAARYSLSSAVVKNLAFPIDPFIGQLQALGLSPKGIDRLRHDLYYENWDFDIQQQLPHSFLTRIAYTGSQGHDLFQSRATNLIDPATGKRPLSQFGQFGIKHNDANSNFNALQISLRRSFLNGFLWQTEYQWSKGIADGSIGAGEGIAVENVSCRACDRSVTPFDVRHNVIASAVYQLPFGTGRHFLQHGVAGRLVGGWDLSGTGLARTGLPVNIVVTRSASNMLDGNSSNQRPDLVANVSIIPAGGQTINQWWNIAAFSVPAKNTWGNSGRYLGRAPGFYEMNAALEKRFPIRESFSASFRAEAFNLLNHAILNAPAANISTPATFGKITGSSNPRKLQLMFRVEF